MWLFGSFIENETTRFRMASKPGQKKGEQSRPSDEEVAEYRRALIDQTPYSKRNIRKKKNLMSLSEYAKRGGREAAKGRTIVQKPGQKWTVE